MAQKTISVRTSDISGAELPEGDGETISFSIGRSAYEIDLSDDEVGAFYDALKPYTDVARRAGTAPATGRPARAAGARQDLSAVREWANANGHEVSARGRIPAAVLEADEAAR